MECAPVALLPITPPIVARSAEAGSGPKVNPNLEAAAFSVERMTPGSTIAVRDSGLISMMESSQREQSKIKASPMACPPKDEPAPRGKMGTLYLAASSTADCRSSCVLGMATPSGSI
jgi:hypothetical protein